MEHESFEDADVGKILNEHFVSIKVDREERPDLDQIYMTAVQMMTQHGGWPMSVFLTPALQPFYGGTYFPPERRHGMPSFKEVLHAIIDAWQHRRDVVEEQSAEITRHIQAHGQLEPGNAELNESILKQVSPRLRQVFDNTYGGFGRAPKFPHPMELRLLLRCWQRFGSGKGVGSLLFAAPDGHFTQQAPDPFFAAGDDSALHMVKKTLDGMAMGGMYDQLGGGFHRYSTDARWLAPHFEKMLYDNALLVPAYLEAYQATGEPFYREVVDETLQYIVREMTSPEGPFYSTQDADSEGVEGKFFVWSKQEIDQILGADLAPLFCSVYDVTEGGNWEEHNILHRTRSYAQDAKMLGLPESELRDKLEQAKRMLFEVRSKRIWPARDEKILTSWNGLMISAFAQAAAALGTSKPAAPARESSPSLALRAQSSSLPVTDYAAAAERAANFIWDHMRTPDGRLLRTTSAGREPKLNGYLEDYSFVIEAFTRLYEATFAPCWIARALALTVVMIDQFWDDTDGGFFYTGRDHEQLIARTKDPHDSSIPSGNSMAVTALLRLAKLTGRTDLLDKAAKTLRLFSGIMVESPHAAGQMLLALDFYLGPVDEIVVVGEPSAADTRAALDLLRAGFRPHQVIAFKPATGDTAALEKTVPLLAGKTVQDAVTVYICRDFTCAAPIVGIEDLRKKLQVGPVTPV